MYRFLADARRMQMTLLTAPYFVFAGFGGGCLEIRIPMHGEE